MFSVPFLNKHVVSCDQYMLAMYAYSLKWWTSLPVLYIHKCISTCVIHIYIHILLFVVMMMWSVRLCVETWNSWKKVAAQRFQWDWVGMVQKGLIICITLAFLLILKHFSSLWESIPICKLGMLFPLYYDIQIKWFLISLWYWSILMCLVWGFF